MENDSQLFRPEFQFLASKLIFNVCPQQCPFFVKKLDIIPCTNVCTLVKCYIRYGVISKRVCTAIICLWRIIMDNVTMFIFTQFKIAYESRHLGIVVSIVELSYMSPEYDNLPCARFRILDINNFHIVQVVEAFLADQVAH